MSYLRSARCGDGRCPTPGPWVSAEPAAAPVRRAAGSPEGLAAPARGLPPFLRAGVMAASVAPRSRALLGAGAAWLRQGGVGELLRARTEGGPPGRDFSLSHYRVRAGWGSGSGTVTDRRAVHGRLSPARAAPWGGGLSLGCRGRWRAGGCPGHALTPAPLTARARSSWNAGGRCRSPERAGSRACTGGTACISWWRTRNTDPKTSWSSSSRSPWTVRPGPECRPPGLPL